MASADVVILGVDWQPRALLRAQLIEQGYEVIATDGWPGMVVAFRVGLPRAAVVDLKNLVDAPAVLDELATLMPAGRVVVLAAAGTMDRSEIERRGFRVVSRPVDIKHVVDAITEAVKR
jgi:hypothetical protein